MKLHYYADTDSLYIDLRAKPSVDSKEVAEGVVIDLDAKGNMVGIDIDRASKRLDVHKLETISFPLRKVKLLRPSRKRAAAMAGGKA